jgi:hypothetical protein
MENYKQNKMHLCDVCWIWNLGFSYLCILKNCQQGCEQKYVKTSGLCVGNKSANMLFIGSEISLPNILTKKNH